MKSPDISDSISENPSVIEPQKAITIEENRKCFTDLLPKDGILYQNKQAREVVQHSPELFDLLRSVLGFIANGRCQIDDKAQVLQPFNTELTDDQISAIRRLAIMTTIKTSNNRPFAALRILEVNVKAKQIPKTLKDDISIGVAWWLADVISYHQYRHQVLFENFIDNFPAQVQEFIKLSEHASLEDILFDCDQHIPDTSEIDQDELPGFYALSIANTLCEKDRNALKLLEKGSK